MELGASTLYQGPVDAPVQKPATCGMVTGDAMEAASTTSPTTCLAERGAHEEKLAGGHLYLLQKCPQDWSLWIHDRPHPCKKTQENKFCRGFGTEVSISFTLQFPAHYFRILTIKSALCFSHELEMKHTFHPNDSTKTNIEINTVHKCTLRNLLLGGGGM